MQTPIVNGQLKTIRYYSYFNGGFDLTKQIMAADCYYNARNERKVLTPEEKEKLVKIKTLEEMYSLVGHDFYVITPCRSRRDSAISVEGTRLTLLKHEPNGFEFAIRTPGTPDRWRILDLELDACFQRIVEAINSENFDVDEVLHRALDLFFFWVNFAPLSRGAAACGYASLLAAVLATGHVFAQGTSIAVWLNSLNKK